MNFEGRHPTLYYLPACRTHDFENVPSFEVVCSCYHGGWKLLLVIAARTGLQPERSSH
jgi:hypothetical protein